MDVRKIMAEGDLSVWLKLAEEITCKYDVQLLQAPETCTIMLQAVDSVGQTPFYVGEVLMTEAAVSVNGVTGYGFALEDDPERAVCAALIDAALGAEVERDRIYAVLAAEEARIVERRRQETGFVAATKVNFAIMEG
jgi:alpha-D-ribose 1-methylphosphonate 5-triphosphate synthase subunit PhnG